MRSDLFFLDQAHELKPLFFLPSARPPQQRPHHGGAPDHRRPLRLVRGHAVGDRLEDLGAVGGGQRGLQDTHVRQGVRILPQLGHARLPQSGQVRGSWLVVTRVVTNVSFETLL